MRFSNLPGSEFLELKTNVDFAAMLVYSHFYIRGHLS